MTLTSDQQEMALNGPCFPLRFLVRPETRKVPREDMVGFSDAAIFHRWMDLFWTLREPEVVALLSVEEKAYLAEFNAVFEHLEWRVMKRHPHISEVNDAELAKLLPSATNLLQALEKRTKLSRVEPRRP